MRHIRISEEEFDEIVRKAITRIPREIGKHFDNIVISVRKEPTEEMLEDAGVEPDGTLLGLFQGVPLIERSVTTPPLYPDMIYLFQNPLEEMCATREELEREIEITLVHEVAHFVGMNEEQLAALGYG